MATDSRAGWTDDLTEVVRREQLLLHPGHRAIPAVVSELLHPQVVEFGASGRVWDRAQLLAALADDPSVSAAASQFVPIRLADDVVLLTYRVGGARGSLRSSIWTRVPDRGWVLRFHQGTPIPGADPDGG